MTVGEVIAYIHSANWMGSVPCLSRTQNLLEKMGNPEKKLKFVHIAGTNGKGSTAAMSASILNAAGYRAGMFTSPYIYRFHERMQIDGEQISESHFMKRILTENGVPEEAIILENQATTTVENMIFGTLQIYRKLKFKNAPHVIIVTSDAHMKRSMALAKAIMPRALTFSAYPAFHNAPTDEWFESEANLKALDTEVRLLKDLADSGFIEDMEI